MEERHPVWYDKTRMALLPDGNKNIFIRFGATHERDGRTDRQTDGHRMPAIAALMHSIARQKPLHFDVTVRCKCVSTLTHCDETGTAICYLHMKHLAKYRRGHFQQSH